MAASRLKHWTAKTTNGLVWFHRWLGIATCLIFALWFASGGVLLFQPFPSLPHGQQMAMAAPVDVGAVSVAPGRAWAAAGGEATGLRLIERGGVPTYLVFTKTSPVPIDARTGARLPLLAAEQARSIVTRGTGSPPVALSGPFDYDQWVVHNRFDPLRPMYRADVGDEAGTKLYVSARTGEIVQRTTAYERGWNWVGAVLHWAYFTPLRASFTAWDRTVWFLSLVAMLVAVAGTVLGVIRTVAVKRAGRPGLTFFRPKWMRYHHLLGLFISIFVLIWILSGWLSMDHGRLFSRGQVNDAQGAAYAGRSMVDAAAQIQPKGLQALSGARDIQFMAIAATPLMVATGHSGATDFYLADGRRLSDVERDRLIRSGIAAAWPGGAVGNGAFVPPTDVYALAEGMPLSALRYDRDGPAPVSIYVDAETGRILTVMDRSRAAYAWIYYALHTFNFPGLTTRPILRYILVLIPLFFGFLFSLTGIVIGYQRLRKSV